MEDRLDIVDIKTQLQGECKVEILSTVDSTNLECKRRIREGRELPDLLVANEQTAGRGRLGREFESPEDSGIYMSLHLLPCLQAEDMVLITSAAAVAVCRAIRAVTGDEPVIKWVNDIFLHDKKICGILAEAITGSDGRIHVVLGIGINVWTNKTQLSEQVQKIAGSFCYVKEASQIGRAHV